MNSVHLIGNLTKDVELRQTNSGKSVATFSIAVQRQFKAEGQPDADFFNIVVWGAVGENCAKYLSKGKKVAIRGSLQNRSYEAQDGSKRTVTEINAAEVEFLSPKATEGAEASQGRSGAFGAQTESVTDDEIPF